MSQHKGPANADFQDAVSQFTIASDHPHREAQQWLSKFLKRLDWTTLRNPSLWGYQSDEARSLPSKMQIAVLKSCIERMVWLRARQKTIDASGSDKDFRINYDVGAVVYGIANDLFRSPLPFSERDVCEILESMRHDCGHGGDVAPPFDLALAHARKHHLSARLLKSLKVYVDELGNLNSAQARGVKRKAELLFAVDDSYGKKRCWSDRFRQGLRELPERELQIWRAMIVQMDAKEFARNPREWLGKVPGFIEALGAKRILGCLSAWWPNPTETPVCPLQTAGSYILQHLVWLLGAVAKEKKHAKACDKLVIQLSELDWKPRERAQKVMVVAARYLETRPPEVSWTAIQRLNRWSESVDKKKGWTGNTISKVLKEYAKNHRLTLRRVSH
jgi:hypothetical protein